MAGKGLRTVEIPEGVEIAIENRNVTVKGPKGEILKELSYPGISIKTEGKTVVISSISVAKKPRSVVGTYESHIKNMIQGVTEGFTAEMKAVFAHFPITIKQEGDIIEIHNFLGEKVPRTGRVMGDAKVKIAKDSLVIEGINKEDVGQTAASTELGTRVTNRDTRVFQDGVYITKKP